MTLLHCLRLSLSCILAREICSRKLLRSSDCMPKIRDVTNADERSTACCLKRAFSTSLWRFTACEREMGTPGAYQVAKQRGSMYIQNGSMYMYVHVHCIDMYILFMYILCIGSLLLLSKGLHIVLISLLPSLVHLHVKICSCMYIYFMYMYISLFVSLYMYMPWVCCVALPCLFV